MEGAPDSIDRSTDLLVAPLLAHHPMDERTDGHMSYDPLMIGTPTVVQVASERGPVMFSSQVPSHGKCSLGDFSSSILI